MFDRLGSLLKSYVDDEYTHSSGRSNASKTSGRKTEFKAQGASFSNEHSRSSNAHAHTSEVFRNRVIVPRELFGDFVQLGLTSSASLEICKKNHKKLMIKYHPDKHVSNPFALIHANEISARINMSFQRICRWFSTGTVD